MPDDGRLLVGNDVFYSSPDQATRQIEIRESYVTRLLNQDILRLQISVDDAHGMEMVERADDLSQIEAYDGRRENPIELAVTQDVEVAAGAVGNRPAQKLVGLEGSKNVGEEGVGFREGQAGKNLNLPTGSALGVVLGDKRGFLDDLKGEGGRSMFIGEAVVDEEHGAHGSFSEYLEGSEIVEMEVLIGRWVIRVHVV